VNTLDKIRKYLLKLLFPPPKFASAEPSMDKKSKKYYADALLSNPIYEEVMKRIEDDCVKLLLNTPYDAKAIREDCYMQYRVLRQIDGYVKGYISDINMEEQLRKLQELQATAEF